MPLLPLKQETFQGWQWTVLVSRSGTWFNLQASARSSVTLIRYNIGVLPYYGGKNLHIIISVTVMFIAMCSLTMAFKVLSSFFVRSSLPAEWGTTLTDTLVFEHQKQIGWPFDVDHAYRHVCRHECGCLGYPSSKSMTWSSIASIE